MLVNEYFQASYLKAELNFIMWLQQNEFLKIVLFYF